MKKDDVTIQDFRKIATKRDRGQTRLKSSQRMLDACLSRFFNGKYPYTSLAI